MNRLTLTIGGAVAGFFLALAFGLWPLWQAAVATKTELGFSQQALNRRTVETSESVSAERLTRLDEALRESFVDLDRSVEFFERLDALADQQVIRASFRFQQEPVPGKRQPVRLTLQASGTLPELLAFLSALESQPFLVTLTSVNLQPDPSLPARVSAAAELLTLWE